MSKIKIDVRRIFLCILFSVAVLSNLAAQVNTDRVLAIGRNALYFEDYILSIQYFNQVVKAKPYLAEPYLYRGIAKFNLEDYQGAVDDISSALERNAFLIYAYQSRGAAYQNLHDFGAAVKDYEKGLEFNPEDRQMLINKGIAHIQGKQYAEAKLTLDKLLLHFPNFAHGYLTRGALYSERGDTLLALADYEKSLEIDKFYPTSYAQRGMLLFQMEKYEEALTDFNEAIRLDPRQIGFYINRGLVKFYLNDLRGTMADYNSVISMEPTNTVARFNRGLLRAQVGDNNRAIEDFDVVIENESDNFSAIYNRATLKSEIADYRGAIQDLNIVLEEYPNFVPGFYMRSNMKKSARDTRGADQDYWLAYNLEQKLIKEREEKKKNGGVDANTAIAQKEEGKEGGKDKSEKTREKSDKSIEKFNRLVTYDKGEESSSKYTNEIRGRVQDKQVKIDLEPQFILSYYEKVEELSVAPHFEKIVADFNKQNILPLQLRLINKEASLSDQQADDHFKSIDAFSLKLVENPQDAYAYFGRAIDFMLLQDLTESINDFGRCIDIDKNFALAYFNRAVVTYKKIQLERYGSDPLENSQDLDLNFTRKGAQVIGKNTVSFVGKKNEDKETEKKIADTKYAIEYDLILKDYAAVIALHPYFITAYFNRANLRCAQKDFRAALVDYSEVILRDAEFAEAYYNRGLTHLFLGNTEKGISDLSKSGELGIVKAYGIIKQMSAQD